MTNRVRQLTHNNSYTPVDINDREEIEKLRQALHQQRRHLPVKALEQFLVDAFSDPSVLASHYYPWGFKMAGNTWEAAVEWYFPVDQILRRAEAQWEITKGSKICKSVAYAAEMVCECAKHYVNYPPNQAPDEEKLYGPTLDTLRDYLLEDAMRNLRRQDVELAQAIENQLNGSARGFQPS